MIVSVGPAGLELCQKSHALGKIQNKLTEAPKGPLSALLRVSLNCMEGCWLLQQRIAGVSRLVKHLEFPSE